jgi:hypothetical protein
MDISVRTEEYQVEDRSWLGSAHGTNATRTITLDVATFSAATHYPRGYIPSGTVLGRITATGLYGPYVNTAGDGREVAAGHLFNATRVVRNGISLAQHVGAPLLEHGFVVEARLPTGHGLDAAAKADLAGRITYR